MASAAALPSSPGRKRDGPPEQDPDWTVGDFTLVSSDNVLFKVDSRVLLGASAALCGMAGMIDDGEKTLTFVDAVLERARIIRKFLRVATTGKLHIESTLSYTLNVLQFCQKYECTAAFEAVLNLLQNAVLMEQPLKLPDVFVIGATVDSVELCTAVLKRGCQILQIKAGATHSMYRRTSDRSQRIGSERASPANEVVSIHDLPDEAWLACRPEYLWALYRASGDAPAPDTWSTFRSLVHAAQTKKDNGDLRTDIVDLRRALSCPCDSATWTKGDLELVSADAVRFRITSYHIRAASPLLGDKIVREGARKVATIRFEDRTLETEHVISTFLSLITTGCIFEPGVVGARFASIEPRQFIPLELRLAAFLKRYECVVPTRMFEHEINGMSDINLMAVGAILDNRALAVRAMRNGVKLSYGFRAEPNPVVDGDRRWPASDPISWPYVYWMIVPPLWLLAFCYAHDHGADAAVRSAFLEDKLRQLDRLGAAPQPASASASTGPPHSQGQTTSS